MISQEEKPTYVRRMFDAIAPTYDFMNTVMTAGAHHLWRRTAAREIVASDPAVVLDLACGTGDLSFAVMQEAMAPCTILGVDFSPPMLDLAQAKHAQIREKRFPIEFLRANVLALPLPDASVDVVTNAFLLRNLVNLEEFFTECHRVLRPGGRFVTLEITHPPIPGFRSAFELYFNNLVPLLGKLLVRHQEAYTYLPTSLQSFPNAPNLATALRDSGFAEVSYRYLGLGTVAVHIANKVP
ncbi:MAG: bifunctional demethylmenaquinone methyltransferase/2-methoxy-6-polyprenyl-1,4-benzoquinol methylase UbiE [Chloroflexi bacterium]|nr:bifunctional demethylmenaquinone methyltransferase/2-methoxy-6-polyprenyl-1,4-benzoquinol methylase UbiE [Chloroflexota bacterium]